MKLLFFDDFRLGALKGDTVVDISALVEGIPHVGPGDLVNGLIASWDEYKPRLEQAVAAGAGVPVSSIRVRPPLPKPTNIDCMAGNYMENGTRSAPAPINGFLKSPSTVIGDGDTMILPDVPATIFEGEAEIAMVIGKPAFQVKQADAWDYIFGFVNFIDGSARGLPPGGFFYHKTFATFGPMGPYLVTKDEVDAHNLRVRLWNNGELMQDYNTSDQAHAYARCLEYISSIHPLEPGDIIPMGTNHRGLHAFQDGDRIELEIDGLGRLHVDIRDDLKRRWPRETRLQRHERGLEGSAPQASGKYAPTEAAAR